MAQTKRDKFFKISKEVLLVTGMTLIVPGTIIICSFLNGDLAKDRPRRIPPGEVWGVSAAEAAELLGPQADKELEEILGRSKSASEENLSVLENPDQ